MNEVISAETNIMIAIHVPFEILPFLKAYHFVSLWSCYVSFCTVDEKVCEALSP